MLLSPPSRKAQGQGDCQFIFSSYRVEREPRCGSSLSGDAMTFVSATPCSGMNFDDPRVSSISPRPTRRECANEVVVFDIKVAAGTLQVRIQQSRVLS
jgi:hypothetical protein